MKGKRTGAVERGIALLLVLLCVVSLAACKKGSDVPLSPGLSMIEGEPIYEKDVAMRTDHVSVTAGMMAFFFYDYGGALMTEMEKTKAYDPSKSLHDQLYTDTLSWYDVMMNATLEKVSQLLIYCEAAKAEGLSLTEEQTDSLEKQISQLKFDAAAAYSLSADAYLQTLYGPLMNEQEFRRVLELEMLATDYSQKLTQRLETGITEEQIDAFARENGLTDDTLSRNMAYLAIPYVGGKANEESVNAVLAALNNAPKAETLDVFAADGTLGSEQNLTPDNMGYAAMKEWLFADARRISDVGRVEIGNSTYILLYTGNGMSYAAVSARMSLYDAAYANWYNTWVEQLTFGYNYDIIDGYDVQ